jgi:hypothetical protein
MIAAISKSESIETPAQKAAAPPLSPLAAAIYKALVRRLHGSYPTLTYGELVEMLGPRHPTHLRSPVFYAALGEVSLACRARGLPCLPALVHGASSRRPGPGYYKVAHPRARTETARLAAWEAEMAAVVVAEERYPPRLA